MPARRIDPRSTPLTLARALLLFAPLALGASPVQSQTIAPGTPPLPATETAPAPAADPKLDALTKTPPPARSVRMLPKWELGAGVAAISMPDYRGSDHQSELVFPFPYFVYRGDILKADRGGVRGRFFDSEHLDVELSLNGGVPVRSKDNEARSGMPDLDPTLEIGPQAIVRIVGKATDVSRLDIRLPVRQVISSRLRNEGWVFTPALNLSITPRDGWQFGAQTGPYFATARYHRYLYEVAPQYATASRPAYRPRGGYGGWQVTTSLTRRFQKLFVGGYIRASTVKGAVFDDSPLVRRSFNVQAGVAVSWVFAQSSELVDATDDE